MFPITAALLVSGLPGVKEQDVAPYVPFMNELFPQKKITTELRVAHFVAQVAHESGNFRYKEENLNYSAESMLRVWPRHFTSDLANACHRQPDKIANIAYANRIGNGPPETGDGWRFRGRGLIQCTGRSNYADCGKALGIDLLMMPDLLTEPKYAVASAMWYWDIRDLNAYADADDLVAITRRINGGTHGLEDRRKKCEGMKAALGIGATAPIPTRKPEF